jgi:hypothetical protein
MPCHIFLEVVSIMYHFGILILHTDMFLEYTPVPCSNHTLLYNMLARHAPMHEPLRLQVPIAADDSPQLFIMISTISQLTYSRSEATRVDFGTGLDWLAPSQPASWNSMSTSTNFGDDNPELGMCPIGGFSGPIQDQAVLGEELEWYQFLDNYSVTMAGGLPPEQIWRTTA